VASAFDGVHDNFRALFADSVHFTPDAGAVMGLIREILNFGGEEVPCHLRQKSCACARGYSQAAIAEHRAAIDFIFIFDYLPAARRVANRCGRFAVRMRSWACFRL